MSFQFPMRLIRPKTRPNITPSPPSPSQPIVFSPPNNNQIPHNFIYSILDIRRQLMILQGINTNAVQSVEQNILQKLRNAILKNIANKSSTEQTNNICPICFNKEIEYCVYPCGHTLCVDCHKRIVDKCFICRRYCDDIIQLYFS